MDGAARPLTFQAVTTESWPDLEALFEARGGPKHCWCMAWRATPDEIRQASGPDRKEQLRSRLDAHTPVGLLGYEAGEPIAWVSVGPRESFRNLGGPDAAPGEVIWSLTCMFVRRSHRRQGIAHRLIDAAGAHARAQGATALEAYPVAPDSPSYRHMGFVPAFEAAAFTLLGTAGSRRHVMRLRLRSV